jgi:WD40 repeat protein/Ca2+-binding EF-hand superfamily protein
MADASSSGQCLSLDWVFGLNRDFKGVVHNLSDGNRKAIFYFVAHTAIIYDVTSHTQKLLQGHRNPIIASCVSANRRFVVTADAGDDCLMIVWDTYSCLPVKFISVAAFGGVLACDISHDSKYIATLSKQTPQTLNLWAWTQENVTGPELTAAVTAKDEQNCLKFSPDDEHLVVTNGAKRVIFWSWAESQWKFYAPPVSAKEVKQSIGNFTQSVFVPGTSLACTATVDGDVLLWDSIRSDKVTKPTDKTLLKVVRVHNGGVTFLGITGNYIVTGGVEGFVRFLDHQLRIVAWYEALNGGPIISVSFDRAPSAKSLRLNDTAETITRPHIPPPDFVVSTANAMIIDVTASSFTSGDPEQQRGRLLVQGQDQPIMALAAHPTLPRLAIAGYSGNIHLWEYSTKSVILLSIFRNHLVHCLAFDPKAMYLGVGFTNGVVKILDANSFDELQKFKPKTADCITSIAFSHDSQFFATADADGRVGLYRFTHRAQDPRKQLEWVFVGRHRTHRAAITGLQFGIVPYGDAPRLMSLGEDKRLVEYNLVDSDIESGLRIRTVHKVTQGAVPTGLLWTTEQLLNPNCMPRARDSKQPMCKDVLVVPTNEYKLKVHATDQSRQCIKTLLSPTFGGPLNTLHVVPAQPGAEKGCLVYSTHEKVVGLIRLPLDGNPRGAMGLLAHPLEISNVAVSHDGKYLFTAGGRDCSVLAWRIDAQALNDGPNGSESRVDHFIDVIEGGSKGAFMKEIIDYFYYAQIRAQGEETTAKREIKGQIPFGQVPNLMRALGYYPSDKEIQHMTFEVDTEHNNTPGTCVDDIKIDFAIFIKLYVNHRPVFGINKRNIEAAFAAVGADPVTGIVDRQELFTLLQNRGEKLHAGDIEMCLKALLGDDVTLDMLEDKITAKAFAENLLGFEDYEDDADNETPAAAAAGE